MSKQKSLWVAFNRGIVSVLGRSRIDVERITFAAAQMVNWMPRVLGSMMLRPGTGYIDSTLNDEKARLLSFQFGVDDTAQFEVSEAAIRVRVNDALITRAAVSAVVLNPDFTTDLTSWTDADDSGGVSAWTTGSYMSLIGDGSNSARRRQQVTVAAPGTAHALRITIDRGPVTLKIGTTAGDDDIFFETALEQGDHSIAFTPASGSFWIELSAKRIYEALVGGCTVEGAGAMQLPCPYLADGLWKLRKDQSGDVIYLSGGGIIQHKLQRRDNDSWSIVQYLPENGPFRRENVTPITLAPSALTGDITLVASADVFKEGNVGSLYRIASQGQTVTADLSAEGFTEAIRVNGVADGRTFSIILSNLTATGNTVTLEQSIGSEGLWQDVTAIGPWTVDTSITHKDGNDNQIIYYRLRIQPGDYAAGTTTTTLNYGAGSLSGVARIKAFIDEQNVAAIVLNPMGSLTASPDWWEGEWSPRRGYPNATALYESRTWWAGNDKTWGSESDLYESFDDNAEGDAGPINRTIGSGPIRNVHWLLPLGRLLLGTARNSANVQAVNLGEDEVLSGRSSSFGEPLTNSNFNMKNISSKAVYVDRSTMRLFELSSSADEGSYDEYGSKDLSILTPDLNRAGIIHIEAQFRPDIRIHCIRADGTVSVMVYDRAEEVNGWIELETAGFVEDVSILPGTEEDQVYYIIRRDIDGTTRRFIEKWALEYEAHGDLINKIADAFLLVAVGGSTVVSGLTHLIGEKVVVWADGKDLSEYDADDEHIGPTVSGSGTVTLSESVDNAVVGLPYEARYRSNKLSSIDALHPGEVRRIEQFQLSLYKTHHLGLKYGPSFDELSDLPQVLDGEVVVEHTIIGLEEESDDKFFPFGGRWSADARLCMKARAPRPATVLACNTLVDTHDK